MTEINFETKTDRELLVLVAQSCNESMGHLVRINGTMQDHEKRIMKVESKMKLNWRSITLLTTFLAMVLMELGNLVHWW
ncbi:MAG: hypothetical protein MUO61_03465 [Dehalococcoidia bacterium]|nr:hypothetical protein [Dehalococcoidia bacterium]